MVGHDLPAFVVESGASTRAVIRALFWPEITRKIREAIAIQSIGEKDLYRLGHFLGKF